MSKIPLLRDADLKGKKVLVRVDHNVVKKGKIKDPFRIDQSLDTIRHILKHDGKPIMMTHVGRPRNKKTGEIEISDETSIEPIAAYLREKLRIRIGVPSPRIEGENGITRLELPGFLEQLDEGRIDLIYLPNTRWFAGEESGGKLSGQLGKEMAALADVFVNDAFGSWQPHTSTIKPALHLPSYAGLLMEKELANLNKVLKPRPPFTAVVAGSKFDTKIGPLTSLLSLSDHLILGGVIYNAYLCAKYDIKIKGIEQPDIDQAAEFLQLSRKYPGKIIEISAVVVSRHLDKVEKDSVNTVLVKDLKRSSSLDYVLDADPVSFQDKELVSVLKTSGTIFVNAVMGLTPLFHQGTTAMYRLIAENTGALKLFGGGDTLQEFKQLLPDIHREALTKTDYYFFTGGGAILKAIEENSVFGMEPVRALMNSASKE